MKKGDIMNRSCYRALKPLERGILVESVFAEGLHKIVTVYEIQFGFTSDKGTINVGFILRTLQEEFGAKGRNGKRFHLKLKRAVYMNYLGPAICYGRET